MNHLNSKALLLISVWLGAFVASAQQAAIFREGFDAGTSGWTGPGFNFMHSASEGNPGGTLKGNFPGGFIPFPTEGSFAAGASASGGAFTGNLSDYGNPTITFDLLYTNLPPSLLYLGIESEDTFLGFYPEQQTPGPGIWHTYSIPIVYDFSQHGPESAFQAALSNVNAITIELFSQSGQTFLLDNVALYASSLQIVSPVSSGNFSTTNASISLSGVASLNLNHIEVRNFRDVEAFPASGTDNWQVDDLPLFAGDNYISVLGYNESNIVIASDSITITYTGDEQYEDLLRSGAVVQHIEFPDDLTPGNEVTVRWQVLSYVPILSRVYAGVPDGWMFYQYGNLAGVSTSAWNLDGRQAVTYAFEVSWRVPEQSGEFLVWFNIAQTDGYQFMIPVIPDGVDVRPATGRPKLIQRTILPGGNGSSPASDQPRYTAERVFESINQSLWRSSTTVTDLELPDNLTPGEEVTATWSLQSYLDIDAEISAVNVASTQIWASVEADRIGEPESTSYSLIDRSTGTRYYAHNYAFSARLTVPDQPGDQQFYFRSRPVGDTNAPWMASTINAAVDSRPYALNGLMGRFIERTINPP